MHRRLALVAFTLLVAGCSSGGGSGSGSAPAVPGVPNNGAPQSTGTANAQVSITIPKPTAAQAFRRSQYISTSTQSMSFAAANGTPVVVALTPTSPGCITGTNGLSCTVNVPLPIGANQQFVVATFASTDGSGTALATNKVSQTIVAGQVNSIKVTLGGVPASVVFSTTTPVPTVVATSYPVNVAVKDASGATIIGSDPFSDANGNPVTVTLADTDTTGVTSLSPATLTMPGTATLAYNDTYFQPATVTLSASATTMTTSTSQLAFAAKSVVIGFVGNGTGILTPNSGLESTARHAASARRTVQTISFNTMTGLVPTGSATAPYALSTHSSSSSSYTAWYNSAFGIATAGNGHVYFTGENLAQSQAGLFDAGTTPALPAESTIISGTASQMLGPLALGPGGKTYAAITGGYEQINPVTGAAIGSPVLFSSQYVQTRMPNAIAVGPDGTVFIEAFVAPSGGDEVLAYSSAGALKNVFWTANSDEVNDAIYGLYVDTNNKVYISEDSIGTIDIVPSTSSGLTLPSMVYSNDNVIDDGANVIVDRAGNILWATYTTVSIYGPNSGSVPPGNTPPGTPWYPSTDTPALQTFHGSGVVPVLLSFGPGS